MENIEFHFSRCFHIVILETLDSILEVFTDRVHQNKAKHPWEIVTP